MLRSAALELVEKHVDYVSLISESQKASIQAPIAEIKRCCCCFLQLLVDLEWRGLCSTSEELTHNILALMKNV